jgi:cold shock CspA family protein
MAGIMKDKKCTGVISRIDKDKGCGFIEESSSWYTFFHISGVENRTSFERMKVGDTVEYIKVDTARGIVAKRVKLIKREVNVLKDTRISSRGEVVYSNYNAGDKLPPGIGSQSEIRSVEVKYNHDGKTNPVDIVYSLKFKDKKIVQRVDEEVRGMLLKDRGTHNMKIASGIIKNLRKDIKCKFSYNNK